MTVGINNNVLPVLPTQMGMRHEVVDHDGIRVRFGADDLEIVGVSRDVWYELHTDGIRNYLLALDSEGISSTVQRNELGLHRQTRKPDGNHRSIPLGFTRGAVMQIEIEVHVCPGLQASGDAGRVLLKALARHIN